jgi:glutathione S-transferase
MRLYDYAPSGNCYKVRLALAHLGLDYERVPVDIFAGDTLTPDYARRNPALTTPVLEYEPGRYLPESAAILLFLTEGTPLLPTAKDERAQVHRWLFFEQSSIVPMLALLRFRVLTGRLDADAPEAEQGARIVGALLATLNAHLAERAFFVDDFTVADIALYGYVHVAGDVGVDPSGFAHLDGWLARVRDQPRHVADLEPYPDNARPGESRSRYDLVGM